MNTNKDSVFLEMAYGLAEKAKGWSSPNPYVGAVIVKKGTIVGTGYHKKPGNPHAEVIALQKAGSQARNATAYITLEPCVHWGRTPPCVDSLIQDGIKRVVVSALDPNPLVHKKGIQKMRQAGIQVSFGLLEEKNTHLNEIYNKYIRQKMPFVTAKVAASLDGKVATKTHDSKWITSKQTRRYSHLLRGEHMAIMVGINTLFNDDPRLTIRHPLWRNKQLIRVIVDSRLRFPLEATLLKTRSKGRILAFTCQSQTSRKALELSKRGVEIISVRSNRSGRLDLNKILAWLGQNEISSVMVEGGALLLTNLFENNLIDKIFVTFSTKLIGGEKAPTFFEGQGFSTVAKAMRLRNASCFSIGKDLVMEGYL
ncbi:MAG: bifunctional diaminohydroxyphosphoribosylaminopyrimidine deaminase/5-amino-6-(5-phosphoribosylamino)uracil reductase RibD [Candidatus Aminicenantes bacterium]|nr:MAG: bifunctional diaminohydroxyphosphoribosylaminopyrimidine deaminase/5-amino-6-(5-phosphoribosylamino)uracil reductase RibD [Candidatus Aminicenantes bacterium]